MSEATIEATVTLADGTKHTATVQVPEADAKLDPATLRRQFGQAAWNLTERLLADGGFYRSA